jgi:hypothetical protein
VKSRITLLAVVALAVVGLVPAAHGTTARHQTTEPEIYDDIDVTISDSRIVLSDRAGVRGNGVNFHIRNTGRRAHNFRLLAQGQVIGLGHDGLGSPTLKPKQTYVLQVYLDYRGTFLYRSTLATDRAKPGMHGTFSVS